jgi:hypothetical protein
MTVLTFVARFDLHSRVEKALSSVFVMDDVASAKECLQVAQLARYEGVLIDSDSLIFVDVLALVKVLRHESSDTSVFVFSRYLDLEQRLCLFEAGVDGCVCEPFFASEMAAPRSIYTAASGGVGSGGIRHGKCASLWRSGAASGATNSGAIGKGDRSAPERISAARIPGTERQSSGDAYLDPGACLELLVRGPDQCSRCVYQRPALQGRSRLSSEVDSDQPWRRLHLHLQQRGAQATPVLAAARLSPRRLRQQATPDPLAIIGKGRSGGGSERQ